MNAHTATKFTVDRDLPQPGWRAYEPVDLLRRYETPDGVGRTLHFGVFQLPEDAIAESGVAEWLPADAKGKQRSADGKWIIAPVST